MRGPSPEFDRREGPDVEGGKGLAQGYPLRCKNMRRFMLLGSLLALLLAVFPHPTAAMTLDDYSRRQNEPGIQFYVAGVGAGFFYTNLYLNELGRAKDYSQPRTVNNPGVAYRTMINQ